MKTAMFQTIDRYLMKEILPPFWIGLLLFTFFLLIDKIFELTELIVNKGVPAGMVLRLLIFILPAFLVLTIPMALLMALLVAFGRLSGDMEIVALKANGVSPLRLLRPVLVLSALACVATGFFVIKGMPWGNLNFKQVIFDILRSRASAGIQERVFNDTFGNFVMYVEEISTSQVGLRGIFIADERNPGESRIITARDGRLLSDEIKRRITLRLLDGNVHEMDVKNPEKYRLASFAIYDLTLSIDNPIVAQAQAPKGDREMTLRELAAQAEGMRRAKANPNPFLVEWHKKFAIPAACLVFAIVGLPLGIGARKGSKAAAVVFGLAIILIYYIFLTTGETLGDNGRIPPWLSMWAPNILVGGIGLYLFAGAMRERPLPLEEKLVTLFYRALALFPSQPRRRKGVRVRPTGSRRRLSWFWRYRESEHIVDRYLVREFVGLTLYGVAVTVVLFVVVDLLQTMERYLSQKPPLSLILEHFLYRIPAAIHQAFPIVVLISTIFLFLSLSRNNELTALKAGGISLYRVTFSILSLTLLISLGSIAFQEFLLPTINQKGEEVDRVKIKKQTLPHLQKRGRVWFRSSENRIFHIGLLDPLNSEMLNVSVYEFGKDLTLRRRIDSKTVRYRIGQWDFEQGIYREFGPNRLDRTTPFQVTTVALAEKFEDFLVIQRAPEYMSFWDLRTYINRLAEGGIPVQKYLVALYSKLAFPLVHFIMALVAIPFALQSPRGGRMIGIGLAVLLGIGYWLLHSLALSLGKMGALPPALAAWTANLFFLGLGGYLFLQART